MIIKIFEYEENILIKRIKQYKYNYILWVLRFEISFSNNLSKMNLRSRKTKIKISGEFVLSLTKSKIVAFMSS